MTTRDERHNQNLEYIRTKMLGVSKYCFIWDLPNPGCGELLKDEHLVLGNKIFFIKGEANVPSNRS